jgi:hypothetical protein
LLKREPGSEELPVCPESDSFGIEDAGDSKLRRDVMSPGYLVNTTIGEDVAPCLSCPGPSCSVERRYTYGEEITAQCWDVWNDQVNATYMDHRSVFYPRSQALPFKFLEL